MATKKHTTTGLIPGHATHTTAANTTELALMTRRLAHFDRLGLDIDQAERQADMLQQRDREADDRRSCLECSNLQALD